MRSTNARTESKLVEQTIYALPGSDEISRTLKTTRQAMWSMWMLRIVQPLRTGVKKKEIALVVVGHEYPLVDGILDVLQSRGIACFGPSKAGARIEADKSWSKDFMKAHGIAFTYLASQCKGIHQYENW